MRTYLAGPIALNRLAGRFGPVVMRFAAWCARPIPRRHGVDAWPAAARANLSAGLRECLAGMGDGERVAVRIRLMSEETPLRAAQRAAALAAALAAEGHAARVAGRQAAVTARLTPGAVLDVAERPDVMGIEVDRNLQQHGTPAASPCRCPLLDADPGTCPGTPAKAAR